MKRYCLALDLKDNPELIKEYEQRHLDFPAVIDQSIRSAGVTQMEIFRAGNRLFMIMEVEDSFSFEKKEVMDQSNPEVQKWEDLMWKFQQKLPFAKKGEKWVLMKEIFKLTD